ncbi:uncharacterized protein BDZ99DRAFT_566310 [Mytilinidion resinicola]|uniref:Uncharacterized protein n=1 Tax=Mytilinidion resinicola TaxID=574789 RepID=A0A6A6Z884_9PEZI|nr:uncharacterized protein BDZ99DRAFT_566310 [Mytilinidion resinicola]KAF2816485.1 hypothetical protein BDZ99DRAFT_566310 [Mytilinidion resinicola]
MASAVPRAVHASTRQRPVGQNSSNSRPFTQPHGTPPGLWLLMTMPGWQAQLCVGPRKRYLECSVSYILPSHQIESSVYRYPILSLLSIYQTINILIMKFQTTAAAVATFATSALAATITASPETSFTSDAPWPTKSGDGWGPGHLSNGPNGPWGSNSDWQSWTTKYGPWNSDWSTKSGPWNDFKSGDWPFGGASNTAWGPWASSGAWQSGPWTQWWGKSDCPDSTWSGWTQGPWGTAAPWTTWSGCTEKTTATNVVTSIISGSPVVNTQYGIQVAAATATAAAKTGSGTATAAAATSTSTGAGAMRTAGVGAAVGAAMLGFAVAL